jgi:hypothetical protein
MAFENFPQSDPQNQSGSNNPVSKNNSRSILTAILVIALLATWGYIIYDNKKTKEIANQKDTLISTTSLQRDELQKELEDAAMKYDMLKSTNSKLDSTITSKDKEILEKRSRIQSILSKSNATSAQLAEAKKLIASLNMDLEGYRNQIAVLQGEKVQLTQEKQAVTEERDQVVRNYDSATVVIKEKEDLINIGSTLQASNFSIIAIDEKNSGKERSTSSAKKVDKLRISFNLNENLIAKSGSKQIYVCITSPDGTPVAVEALGSGTFSTRDGQEKIYTQKIEVNYTQNKRQTVSFDWKQNTKFLIGNYKIEVYNNGFKVGESVKTLAKSGLFG